MNDISRRAEKDLYARLRLLSCDELWTREAAQFDRASPSERLSHVAVIRAVGAAFARSGTPDQKEHARAWLRTLLHDPAEKVRRYAMSALPKLAAGPLEEAELLSLLRSTIHERERHYIAQALDKIGGAATLHSIAGRPNERLLQTEQKVKARVLRADQPSLLQMETVLDHPGPLTIHLRGRVGLEGLIREEVQSTPISKMFRAGATRKGLVEIQPLTGFSLSDLYRMRCFATAGFVLGATTERNPAKSIDALAAVITSPRARRVMDAFTAGPVRYRLSFAGHGHQRAAVRQLANRIYALCPEILNDPQKAPWTISIFPSPGGQLVELNPKLSPDPRFAYRQDDVPAASHPPLAACLARLAGARQGETVWDPFCGSGLELIERALLGGVERVYGTDLSPTALDAARTNFAAAGLQTVPAQFACCDFRRFETLEGLGPNTVTLMITNPPLGKRVPVPDMCRLMKDLFSIAARVLSPGGHLVLINPLNMEKPHTMLRLQFREMVDVGILSGRLEKYEKLRG